MLDVLQVMSHGAVIAYVNGKNRLECLCRRAAVTHPRRRLHGGPAEGVDSDRGAGQAVLQSASGAGLLPSTPPEHDQVLHTEHQRNEF